MRKKNYFSHIKFYILFIGLYQFISFCHVLSLDIALLTLEGFSGEFSFAQKVRQAGENIGWSVEIYDIQQTGELDDRDYDLVINLIPYEYYHPRCKNYLTIFHPRHHFFDKVGTLAKKYGSYDGYLLTYEPKANDMSFGEGSGLRFMKWYPTVQSREYVQVDPSSLFFICSKWGARGKGKKYLKFQNLLGQQSYTRFYGAEEFGKIYPKAYKGPIPFDGQSVFHTIADAGVCLVLHSRSHLRSGLPSGRIFEAAASSAVIISDANPFVEETFGSSVLYIDVNKKKAKDVFKEIDNQMKWIRANKSLALEKAKRSHEIFMNSYTLEKQLLRLEEFHNSMTQTP